MSVTKTINSVSIPYKIASAFLAILLVIGGLAALSIHRVASTNTAVQEMVENYIGSLGFLDEMRSDVARYQSRLNRELWSLGQAGAVPAADADLVALEGAFRDSDAKYAPTVWNADEARLHDMIGEVATRFFREGGAARAALRAGRIDEAKARMADGVAPAAEALDRALLEDYNLNSRGAVSDAGIVARNVRDGLLDWLVVLGAVVVFVAAAGVFLFESIGRPIKSLNGAMSRLVGGDVDVPIPERDREDEVGEMAHLVDAFRQTMLGSERRRGKT